MNYKIKKQTKLNEFVEICFALSRNKGFWENDLDILAVSRFSNHVLNLIIFTKLSLVLSELAECRRAYEKDLMCHFGSDEINNIIADKNISSAALSFKECVKDTFEDELADILIRVFDLLGFLANQNSSNLLFKSNDFFGNKKPDERKKLLFLDSNKEGLFSILFFIITDCLELIRMDKFNEFLLKLKSVVFVTHTYCLYHNIDINTHIKAKLFYNESREYLHGKTL